MTRTRSAAPTICLLAAVALTLPGAVEASKWNPSPDDADLCTPFWLEGAAPSERAAERARAAIASSDPKARAEAADTLGRADDPEAVPALVAALGDPSPQARQLAARALGRLGDPRAAGPLADTLARGDKNLRQEAAWALGRIDADVEGALAGALGDPAPHVRWAAACSLGKVGGPGSVPALRRAARDGDEMVRAAAGWALDRLGAGGR